jgi:hypothetical protein
VVEVTKLEGRMLMWLPPPPSDRLWISFLAPPKVITQFTQLQLVVHCTTAVKTMHGLSCTYHCTDPFFICIQFDQPPDVSFVLLQVALSVKPLVAGRVLKHPALASHVCRWLEARLLRLTGSSLVFPAAADISLPTFQGACSCTASCSPSAAAAAGVQGAEVLAGRASSRQLQRPGRSSRNSSGGSSSKDFANRWQKLAAAGASDCPSRGFGVFTAADMQQQMATGCDIDKQEVISLTSSSSSNSSSYEWAGDAADSQQQQQHGDAGEEEWWMGEASSQLPKSEPKQSVMGASAPMTPRDRSSSAGRQSC